MMELGNGWYWRLRRIYAHRFWLVSNERLNLQSTPQSTLVFSGWKFLILPSRAVKCLLIWTDFSDEWCGPWVSCSMMGLLICKYEPFLQEVSVDQVCFTLLVFLHRIEQLKALVFDSSSDTSSSSPDSSCHYKRRKRKYWKYSSSPSKSKKKRKKSKKRSSSDSEQSDLLEKDRKSDRKKKKSDRTDSEVKLKKRRKKHQKKYEVTSESVWMEKSICDSNIKRTDDGTYPATSKQKHKRHKHKEKHRNR